MNTLGIEIGGTKLQLVLGDAAGHIHQHRRLEVKPDSGAKEIQAQIVATIPDLLQGRAIDAVGVGFGGPVDWRTGIICRSHQIEGWSDFDLAGWLQQVTGARVFVDNDANVAALAEARFGAGAGCDPVFYVTLGSGVGGGLVSGGRIYHGANPGEAEIGHVRLDRNGTTVEARCSGWAVDRKIRELKDTDPSSLLVHLAAAARGGEAIHLATALKQGDAVAQRIISEMATDLALGLSHVVHLLHPQVIILGGGLAGVGELLCSEVKRALRNFTMTAFVPGLQIRPTAIGDNVVPLGALLLAGQSCSKS